MPSTPRTKWTCVVGSFSNSHCLSRSGADMAPITISSPWLSHFSRPRKPPTTPRSPEQTRNFPNHLFPRPAHRTWFSMLVIFLLPRSFPLCAASFFHAMPFHTLTFLLYHLCPSRFQGGSDDLQSLQDLGLLHGALRGNGAIPL